MLLYVLNSLFHCRHPSIWNLLNGLRRDIACQRLLLANAQTGRPEIIKKKYYVLTSQEAIIVQGYLNQENKFRPIRQLANLQ